MRRSFGRWLTGSAAVLVIVAVVGCGGSATGKSGSADPPSVAARVGGTVITAAMVNHWLAVEGKGQAAPLVPPRFAACITRLEAAPTGATGTVAGATAPRSVTALKGLCEQIYEQLRAKALSRLISETWVVNGARELGADVTGAALQHAVAAAKHRSFHTEAAYHSYLTTTGRTSADIESLVHTEVDSQAIREALDHRVGPITPARVRGYYEQHKAQYGVKQKRAVEIVGAPSGARALAAKRQIASGKSFASVAKDMPPKSQPLLSVNGLVPELESGLYKERSLNDAIFSAKPGVLTGPIKTEIGYYVFRVKLIHPAVQMPLSTVAASIRKQLPETLEQQMLVSYIKSWRAKWTTKTDCSRTYVIPKCRQYKQSAAAAEGEDPYTLN